MKICLISDLHLSSNPRLWKEASTLKNAGYQVSILTIWTSSKKKEIDLSFIQHKEIEYRAALNLIEGEVSFFKRFYIRFWSKLNRIIKRKLNYDTFWSLGYAPKMIFNKAFLENADLYIAHTEYGMAIGKMLIEQGKKVAFDIEDWYSQDYLVPERPIKLLQNLEKFALEKGVYCTCPSQAMARDLEQTYINSKPVHVIYNGFSQKENIAEPLINPNKIPSLVWFSQTIGEGRGLETVIEALKYVSTKIELHLIGECVEGYDVVLKTAFPFSNGHQLFIHSPVQHFELLPIISKHSIGLAIEQTFPESRNKTITNKVLQYIQAGVKILATDTDGQKEVAVYFKNTITLVPVNAPKEWASAIDVLIHSLEVDKKSQLEQFNKIFSWEAQEKQLLHLVSKALQE